MVWYKRVVDDEKLETNNQSSTIFMEVEINIEHEIIKTQIHTKHGI